MYTYTHTNTDAQTHTEHYSETTKNLHTGLEEDIGAREQVQINGNTATKRVSEAPKVPTLKEPG